MVQDGCILMQGSASIATGAVPGFERGTVPTCVHVGTAGSCRPCLHSDPKLLPATNRHNCAFPAPHSCSGLLKVCAWSCMLTVYADACSSIYLTLRTFCGKTVSSLLVRKQSLFPPGLKTNNNNKTTSLPPPTLGKIRYLR